MEVLTGFPNYPLGKLYAGYTMRLFKRESLGGIRVNRVPLFPSYNHSAFLRILNYLSFCLSAALIGPFLIREPDIVYVYNLPTLMVGAAVIRALYGSKVVLDIQDLWPESVSHSGMISNSFSIKILEKVSYLAYSAADRITVLSPGFKTELVSRGISAGDISVIYNWCSETAAHPTEASKDSLSVFGFGGHFNIVYTGTIGKMQGLDAVIEAASIVGEKNNRIHFWLVGGGVEVDRLKDLASRRNTTNVHFIPRVSSSEASAIMRKADTLLVHLKRDPLLEITIPSKIQSYMLAGKPLLAGVGGDAAELVKSARAGVTCVPGNPESIAEKALLIAQMDKKALVGMGENGRQYYLRNLSLQEGTRQYLDLFDEALGSTHKWNS